MTDTYPRAKFVTDDKPRTRYWRQVSNLLLERRIALLDGGRVQWDALELFCETRGFLRKNIPDPSNMARVAERILYPTPH